MTPNENFYFLKNDLAENKLARLLAMALVI